MRKVAGNIVLILAIALFIISSTDGFTRIVAQAKYATQSWWGSDKYQYGDLYGMTYLPQFRIRLDKPEQPIMHCAGNTAKSFNIYAIADSYTWDIFKNPNNFCGAAASGFSASNFQDVLPINFDRSKENILVIETNERNARTLLTDTAYLARAIHPIKPGEDTSKLETMSRRKQLNFNYQLKGAEANFEFNIWDYRFLTPLKELKARINAAWFNRIPQDAYISPDQRYLLYNVTIDTAYKESSFRPIDDKEIDRLVNSLNYVYDHYKKLGFTRIYLAVIPNPVSILFPDYNGQHYNQTITKLENNPALKLQVFDSYRLFKANKGKLQLYRRSDTHWTAQGEKFWLEAFNRQLQADMKR